MARMNFDLIPLFVGVVLTKECDLISGANLTRIDRKLLELIECP